MIIKPLGNRLVVRLVKQKNTTASGIILSTKTENEQAMGEILSIGAGASVENEVDITKMGLSVGQTILFGKYSGEEVKDEQDPETVFKILSSKDILAIIEN